MLSGVVHGDAFVLRKLSNGIEQQKCLEMVSDMKPLCVLGSPQCASFSQLQNLNVGEKYLETLEVRHEGLQDARGWTAIVAARASVELSEDLGRDSVTCKNDLAPGHHHHHSNFTGRERDM